MVSIREIQSGIVEEEENKVNSENASVAQTDNFLDAVNIEDSSAADLDKRFFSGAVPNSAKMRNEIDNAIGYKSFKTFYDDYVEFNTKYNKGAKLKPNLSYKILQVEVNTQIKMVLWYPTLMIPLLYLLQKARATMIR